MNVSYEEIGRVAATFPQNGCTAGQVCKINSSGTVVPCASGDKFIGVVEGVRNGFAGVQVEGFVRVPSSGSFGTGFLQLCADGEGGAMIGAGREYLVISWDPVTETIVIKL